VNASGETIPQARLCWGSFNDRGGGSTCGTEADNDGNFSLQVSLDTNRVWADKPSDGYWSDVQVAESGVVVKLTPQKPSTSVVIKLGASPGHINFNIVDKNAGSPIKDFHISVATLDQTIATRAQLCNQSSIAVPADKDVLIMVEANGYKRWFYMESGASQPTVRLQSGEERNVEADLEPEAKPK
jgi:hypothetical protein